MKSRKLFARHDSFNRRSFKVDYDAIPSTTLNKAKYYRRLAAMLYIPVIDRKRAILKYSGKLRRSKTGTSSCKCTEVPLRSDCLAYCIFNALKGTDSAELAHYFHIPISLAEMIVEVRSRTGHPSLVSVLMEVKYGEALVFISALKKLDEPAQNWLRSTIIGASKVKENKPGEV